MSYDSSYHEFHLTSSGWIRGTSYFSDEMPKEIIPPEGRIETWARTMRQQSGWSKENVYWKCIWKSSNHSDEERKTVRDNFPKPFRDFITNDIMQQFV
jgi:hypothetical protein